MRILGLCLTALLVPCATARADQPTNPYDRISIFGWHESLLLGGSVYSAQTRVSREAFGRTHALPDTACMEPVL